MWTNTNSVGPALNQRCGLIAERSGQELLKLGQSTGSIAGLPHNRSCEAGPASGDGGPALYQHGTPKH